MYEEAVAKRCLTVYTIGAELKESDTTTSVAVPEGEHQIRCEHDDDTNCEYGCENMSEDADLTIWGSRRPDQGCGHQGIGNERQASWKLSSPLLVACMRGGGASKVVDKEYHLRYISLSSFGIKRKNSSDVFSTPRKLTLAAPLYNQGPYTASTSNASPRTTSSQYTSFSFPSPFAPSSIPSSIDPLHASPNTTKCCSSPDAPKTSSTSETIMKQTNRYLKTGQ